MKTVKKVLSVDEIQNDLRTPPFFRDYAVSLVMSGKSVYRKGKIYDRKVGYTDPYWDSDMKVETPRGGVSIVCHYYRHGYRK